VIDEATSPVVHCEVQECNSEEAGKLWLPDCVVPEQCSIYAFKLLPDSSANVGWKLLTEVVQ
jgi:hypothetical protein